MEVIPVTEGATVVRLANGRALMVGAPPEALKLLLLWGSPTPYAVVLAPDPLYVHGVNLASFEFLVFNYLFRENRVGQGEPFYLICDAGQQPRIERMVREMLRGPDEAQMTAWETPAAQRRQLMREMHAVSGEVAGIPVEDLVRVIPFRNGEAVLPDGVRIQDLPPDDCVVSDLEQVARVPRRPRGRGSLPFFFPEPKGAAQAARFGIQVIGSASGFTPSDWSSCFIVWINGLPLVVDGTPYLDEHLEHLGIEEDQITGYVVTHTHEDHANAIGQLIDRRRVRVLTAPPVMAGLVTRLASILGIPRAEVPRMIDYVPLRPGLTRMGSPCSWYGAEIRSWYSVHTLPTVGLEFSLNGQSIRLPGDTLWGRQLDALRDEGFVSRARARFIQSTYAGADVVVADAGGGPIHPDPQEVSDLRGQCSHHLLVTHAPWEEQSRLENVRSGAVVTLQPLPTYLPDDLLAVTTSAALREVSELQLQALVNSGEVLEAAPRSALDREGCLVLLRGRALLRMESGVEVTLQRGDFYHPAVLPAAPAELVNASPWTRLLTVPPAFSGCLLAGRDFKRRLCALYRTRAVWNAAAAAELPLDTLVALARAGSLRSFAAGAAVVEEGERSTGFFVVLEGRVEVVTCTPHSRHFGVFGPGYYFGEIGLLDRSPRTATVRALDPTDVLRLSATAFRRHLLSSPLARYHLTRTRDQRLAEQAK